MVQAGKTVGNLERFWLVLRYPSKSPGLWGWELLYVSSET